MANSADPDQLASSTDLDLHCSQMQGISGFSRTRVKSEYIMALTTHFCLISASGLQLLVGKDGTMALR